MNIDHDDILTSVISPEIANERADTYRIFGQELQPFSAQRVAAAFQMGKTYPNVPAAEWVTIGQQEIEDPETGEKKAVDFKVYPQLFQDAVTVLYLCTLPPSLVKRAFRNPDEMLDAAFKWADDNKLSATGDRYSEAVATFMKIESDIRAAEHKAKPKIDPEGAAKEDADPL